MLITKELDVRWSAGTKQWYIDKGYEFTKLGDVLTVKVNDLPVNSAQRIQYKCVSCGDIVNTPMRKYSNRKGHTCRKCSIGKLMQKRRNSWSTIAEEFALKGYVLLSTSEDYINAHSKLRYLCNDATHGEQSVSIKNLREGKGCPKCANERMTGDTSPVWKGGVTELNDRLRKVIKQWTQHNILNSHRTCEITGLQGELNVHHMTSFASIRDLTLQQLGLPIYQTIGEYGDDLQLLEDTFLENNERLANPVVMLESVHQAFHVFCGGTEKSTSPQQLEEFKESYTHMGIAM